MQEQEQMLLLGQLEIKTWMYEPNDMYDYEWEWYDEYNVYDDEEYLLKGMRYMFLQFFSGIISVVRNRWKSKYRL